MISTVQQEILNRLSSILAMSPGIRVGQMLSHLDFLAQDCLEVGAGDIDDEKLLQIIRRHEEELSRRQSNVA